MSRKRVTNEEVSIMKIYLKICLDKLYKECEHGDEDHRKWLKDKFNDFYNRQKDDAGG